MLRCSSEALRRESDKAGEKLKGVTEKPGAEKQTSKQQGRRDTSPAGDVFVTLGAALGAGFLFWGGDFLN